MDKEQSNGIPETEPESTEEQNVADDLRFMRSVIEKTQQAFAPGDSLLMIVMGLIFMVGYPATQLLSKPQLYGFIQPMWIILWVIGAFVGMFNGFRCELRQRHTGVISRIGNQIGLIWYILLLNGTAWSAMAMYNNCFGEVDNICFGELAFLWAVIFGFGLSVMGILSSKEWLFGGIAVLISIVAASILKEHAYYILGIVMGLACIIPAIIAQRNYRKQEKNYE